MLSDKTTSDTTTHRPFSHLLHLTCLPRRRSTVKATQLTAAVDILRVSWIFVREVQASTMCRSKLTSSTHSHKTLIR